MAYFCQNRLQDQRASVTVNFQDVFTGIGAGFFHERDQHFIKNLIRCNGDHVAVAEMVRL